MTNSQDVQDLKPEVRIHIDREPYQSPNPTTGAALYRLADIGPHQELFREVDGDHEDEPIPNNDSRLRLVEDEHFYSAKEFTIIVNGRKKTVAKPRLTFAEVVALAFDDPPTGANILITVTYRHGPPANPEGSLLEGQSVKIKNGMVFNVRATDKS